MATCKSADSILEAAALIKANGAKINTFTNGGETQTVQLGTGEPTPVLRNLVRQMYTTAAEVENASVDGKFVIANGATESRTLASRFADVVNVKDFGAAGDGETDDTQAFKDAAEAAGSGIVFVPHGSYSVSESVVGNFYSDGLVSFTSLPVEVHCTSYSGRPFRKSIRFKALFQFPEYSAALEKVRTLSSSITSLYPQACCHAVEDGKEYLYIYYQSMPSAVTTNVLVKYSLTHGEYIGYWILPSSYSGEGLAVVERSGTRYVYACSSSSITRYVLAGASGSTLAVSNDDFALIPFGRPFFSRSDSGSWIVVGYHPEQPTVRPPMLSIYSDAAELVSQFYWDAYDFDTLLNYNAYDPDQMAIPHKQGIFYDAGYVYLFAGGSSNLSGTYNVSDIGVIQKNLFGGVVRSSVCKAAAFADRLSSMLGETVQWTESEGGYVYDGRVYSLVVARTASSEHVLLMEEFSEDAASVDFSDCIASSSNIPWNIDRHYYPRYGVSDTTYKNPFTNANLSSLDDFIVMMAKYGFSEITVNLFGTAIEPTIGSVYIAESKTNQPIVVDIKKQSNSTFFVVVHTREGGVPSSTTHSNFSSEYLVYVNASTWTITSCIPISKAVGCCFDLCGSSVEISGLLSEHSVQTPMLRLAEESGSAFLRLGRSSDTNASGVNNIVLTIVDSSPGEAADTDNRHNIFFRYNDVFATPDNTVTLGSSTFRWKEIFAGTATVNTSDERLKENISVLSEPLMRAWGKVRLVAFQFSDAVRKKGEDARLHIGVVAQQVRDAFASEGLDASRYGLFCHDEWEDQYETETVVDEAEHFDDETGTLVPAQTHEERRLVMAAGDRYGIRYEEALALECAYQRWLGEKRDARIAELEARLNEISGSGSAPFGASPDNL